MVTPKRNVEVEEVGSPITSISKLLSPYIHHSVHLKDWWYASLISGVLSYDLDLVHTEQIITVLFHSSHLFFPFSSHHLQYNKVFVCIFVFSMNISLLHSGFFLLFFLQCFSSSWNSPKGTSLLNLEQSLVSFFGFDFPYLSHNLCCQYHF